MPQFQSSEIDDAKKRVREMQERTKQFSDTQQNDEIDLGKLNSLIELFSSLKGKDNTQLALFSLLSAMKEDCDKTLIMALLYILL